MKKLIIFASVLALTFSMSMNAFASEVIPSEQSTIKQEQKKEDAGAFRDAVKEKRDAVKENRENNVALRQENKELRRSLAASLKEIKDSGVVLDEEVATKLEECNVEMKASISALKDTKGDIKEIAAEKKEYIKARDYDAMEAAFDEIYDIQASRNAALAQINELLKEMIALL